MITSTRSIIIALLMCTRSGTAIAGPLAAGIASGVPVEIGEVVAGGTWIDGSASGSFRIVTVQISGDTERAEVYLQWIGSRTPVDPIQIITSVGLREFNDMKAAWASVAIDAETAGTAKVTVSGQDGEQQAIGPMTFIATLPGVYTPEGKADEKK